MSWNYRVCRTPEGWLAIYEVHYDAKGKANGITAGPILGPYDADGTEKEQMAELVRDLVLVLAATTKGILDYAEIANAKPKKKPKRAGKKRPK